MIMNKKEMAFSQLVKRVKQQEKVIAQLIKVVAATNQRMTHFVQKETAENESRIIN